MLTLDEHMGDDGVSVFTTLEVAEGALRLRVGADLVGDLPFEALDAVMDRYGKPLADDVAVEGPSLEIAAGTTLRRLRHRARYDVLARDFLVLERASSPPLAELARPVAAALVHLARAATRATGP